MNAMQLLASQPWVERLGWTLVHFLWQGLLIAVLYAAARHWMLPSASPNARYVLGCGALAVMMAVPPVTLSLMHPSETVSISTDIASRLPAAVSGASTGTRSSTGVMASHESGGVLLW